MGYATSIVLGSLDFSSAGRLINSANPERVPATKVRIVGGDIILKRIPNISRQDWRITFRGMFFDTTKNTDRDTLQALRNNNTKFSLTDGIHNGEYRVLSLRWPSDQNPTGGFHSFIIEIIEDQ